MKTGFFGNKARWGIFCALFTALALIFASCGGDNNSSGDGNKSSPSSSSYDNQLVINKDIKVDTVWIAQPSPQFLYLEWEASIQLTTNDPEVKGFDYVVVKINGEEVKRDCENDGYICNPFNYNYEIDESKCGEELEICVEAYAFGTGKVEARECGAKLRIASDTGACRSSSSEASSSSLERTIKPFAQVSPGSGCTNSDGSKFLVTTGGINLSDGSCGSGGDITYSYSANEIIAGSSVYSLNDQFLNDDGGCGVRGSSRPRDNTEQYGLCNDGDVNRVIPCASSSVLVRTTAAKDAEDWVPGWYLIRCAKNTTTTQAQQGAYIEVWKVN
jgi:hypothetical protein